MKKLLVSLLLAAGFTSAYAQVSGNATIASEYRFRGISQTQGKPALQGGVDYAHKSGLYIGNWNSSVSGLAYTNSSGLESDFYGGYKTKLLGLDLDAGLYTYTYGNASTYNTNEFFLGAGRGPVSVKYSQTYSDKYFGTANARGTRYYEINVAQPVTKKITVVAHAGRTDVANNSNSDYNDFNAGVVVKEFGFDFGARYYYNNDLSQSFKTANTISGKQNYGQALVLSVTKQF